MRYEVQKPLSGGGVIHQPGEVLDDDGWPVGRAAKLVAQRYLMPAGVDPDAPTPRLGSRRTAPGRQPREASR